MQNCGLLYSEKDFLYTKYKPHRHCTYTHRQCTHTKNPLQYLLILIKACNMIINMHAWRPYTHKVTKEIDSPLA